MLSHEKTAALCADALAAAKGAVALSLPDAAVKATLAALPPADPNGKTVLVAIGKAAWQMAKAALDFLQDDTVTGVVVTKYGHAKGPLGRLTVVEAGHPVPDENSVRGAEAAMEAVKGLDGRDRVLFLVSGGGSAVFEKPLVPLETLAGVTEKLLRAGASIGEINTIRRRLSAVKGGRFGALCAPARVEAILLSDVLGDPPDVIASGPAYPDASTAADAERIAEKYLPGLPGELRALLTAPTPKELPNVSTTITGGVRKLCRDAADIARSLGYEPILLTDCASGEAREVGRFLASAARTQSASGVKRAYLVGGETVVRVKGHGKGGRNQELALAAAEGLEGLDACLVSLGSDGTDGPTDAAGGIVSGETAALLREKGIDLSAALEDNDAYTALSACGGLVFTGPTGTNVNDITILLLN